MEEGCMRKKQVAEILKRDFEDYYNMDDRIGDLKSQINFNSMGIVHKNMITMRKSKFITACILSSLLLVGGSSAVTYIITQKSREYYEILYRQSIHDASAFLEKEFDTFVSYPIQTYSYEDRTLFNVYKGEKEQNDFLSFQIYTKNLFDIFTVKFSYFDDQITIYSDLQHRHNMQILNFDYDLIPGYMINGSIFVNERLYKNIALIV